MIVTVTNTGGEDRLRLSPVRQPKRGTVPFVTIDVGSRLFVYGTDPLLLFTSYGLVYADPAHFAADLHIATNYDAVLRWIVQGDGWRWLHTSDPSPLKALTQDWPKMWPRVLTELLRDAADPGVPTCPS